MQTLSTEIIKNTILENYVEYQYLFTEFQSKFLSDLYARHQSLENANLVLYFAKKTHQDILRERDYDFNFNISYKKFWQNHSKIDPKQISIIKIATDTLLPKETARRKILQLVKQKVLSKKNRNIGWLPNEQYKQNYNLFTHQEIEDVSRLIIFLCQKLNYPISREAVTKEIRDKFSFYWFHYLEAQLEYFKICNKQFKDFDLMFIFLQLTHLFTSKKKQKKLSYKKIYSNPSLLKDFINISISATSISEVTKIPRATCVRKLEFLVKLRLILQDNITKKYYVVPNDVADNLISKKVTEQVVKNFSNFFFICLRAIDF